MTSNLQLNKIKINIDTDTDIETGTQNDISSSSALPPLSPEPIIKIERVSDSDSNSDVDSDNKIENKQSRKYQENDDSDQKNKNENTNISHEFVGAKTVGTIGTVISKKFHPIYMMNKFPWNQDWGCDYLTNQVFPEFINVLNLEMVAEIQLRREIFVQSAFSMLLHLKNFGYGIAKQKNVKRGDIELCLGLMSMNYSVSSDHYFYLDSCFNGLYGKDMTSAFGGEFQWTTGRQLFLNHIPISRRPYNHKSFLRFADVGLKSAYSRINFLLNKNGLHLKTKLIERNSGGRFMSFKLVRIDQHVMSTMGKIEFVPW